MLFPSFQKNLLGKRFFLEVVNRLGDWMRSTVVLLRMNSCIIKHFHACQQHLTVFNLTT